MLEMVTTIYISGSVQLNLMWQFTQFDLVKQQVTPISVIKCVHPLPTYYMAMTNGLLFNRSPVVNGNQIWL